MRFPFPRIRQWFESLRGRTIEFDLAAYQGSVAEVRRRCEDLTRFPDGALQERAHSLKEQARRANSHVTPAQKRNVAGRLETVLDAFAVSREASRRVLGMQPFDTQMVAGLALHQGKLAQMQTGEGKTLAAVAPVYAHALAGNGVHVLTFNDYLAQRDAQWMGPVYEFLGLRVRFVQQGMSTKDRQAAYGADVTYVTAKEAGFDYLRDGLCSSVDQIVHRPFYFALVDEADSILIDEARIPLVVAGGELPSQDDLRQAAEVVRRLDDRGGPQAPNETLFETDRYGRNVHFTASGLDWLERELGCGNLHDQRNVRLLTRLNLALHAHRLLERDVDYLVRDDKIELIDEFTGRVAENRRWPYGLQEAIEAKEGVPIQPQGRILSSITLQHFLRLYPQAAGMTATAQTAAEEFEEFYGMTVVVIEPHRPCIRENRCDLVFSDRSAKHAAIAAKIQQANQQGRPVLVGTASVDESEQLASRLRDRGVGCEVLNARSDKHEAQTVARAGSLGAVTISTNMAGRGVDIRLGGTNGEDRNRIAELGGLLVIGAARYESRRIDDQLRGRAGRQGDPGASQFMICLQDTLLQRYQIGEVLAGEQPSSKPSDEHCADPFVDRRVDRKIEHIQRIIEGESFEIRKTLRRYSAMIEAQRGRMRAWRDSMLLQNAAVEIVERRAPDRLAEVQRQFDESIVADAARRIALFHLDHRWTEYLAHVAEIRESIHLFSYGGFSPLDEFHKQVNTANRDLYDRIEHDIAHSFRTIEFTDRGVDLAAAGLRGPSSTWTYLINDAPLGDVLDRISRRLKTWFRRTSE